ncbi:hypothetical protein CXG81DRAFT_19968 [Caulochytrium protostelioides]|uniref:Uncharacterized protein n=1 Tax=Caulochytrium protostelioides TaxID=1555241 RepID=A0A4P9X4P0_9FUNG|nr:hypothetical protein CXG81DRAFT_19968 [Caulochytrium protostelioides]|eukprot:RKP00034.1 hypothetical protein CXG81DRAFT_19968 [Caulochytrium protostelioides]
MPWTPHRATYTTGGGIVSIGKMGNLMSVNATRVGAVCGFYLTSITQFSQIVFGVVISFMIGTQRQGERGRFSRARDYLRSPAFCVVVHVRHAEGPRKAEVAQEANKADFSAAFPHLLAHAIVGKGVRIVWGKGDRYLVAFQQKRPLHDDLSADLARYRVGTVLAFIQFEQHVTADLRLSVANLDEEVDEISVAVAVSSDSAKVDACIVGVPFGYTLG